MSLPIPLMSNLPSVRPTLNLQFDNQPTPEDMLSHLTSYGATYSRASTATYVDANGLIKEASVNQPRPNYNASTGVHEGFLTEGSGTNLAKSSEDLSTTNWSEQGNATVTINQAISPSGDASADLIDIGNVGTDMGADRILQNITLSTTTYTFSAFVKKVDAEVIGFRHYQSGNDAIADFSFDTEEFISTNSNVNYTTVENVGNGWYRISITSDKASGDSNIRIGGQIGSTVTTTGKQFYLWGVELKNESSASSYIPTIPTFTSRASTATYVDSNGVIQTASINEERTENHVYIDGQWVDSGQLLESSSTNSFPYSNSNYTVSGGASKTASSESAFGISLTKVTASSVNYWAGINTQPNYVTNGTTSALSWCFHFGNSPQIEFRMRNNTNATESVIIIQASDLSYTKGSGAGQFTILKIEELPSGVYKLYGVHTANADGDHYVRTGTGRTDSSEYVSSGLFQMEEGKDYPTSYIPTSGSTVTRSADVFTTATKTRSKDICYIDGTAFTDFYNASEGTILCESILYDLNGDNFERIWNLTGDSLQERNTLRLHRRGGELEQIILFNKKNNVLNSRATDVDYDQYLKTVVTYNENFDNTSLYKDGVSIGNANNSESLEVPMTKLSIGMAYNSASQLEGSIKSLVFFPKILTEAQKLSK